MEQLLRLERYLKSGLRIEMQPSGMSAFGVDKEMIEVRMVPAPWSAKFRSPYRWSSESRSESLEKALEAAMNKLPEPDERIDWAPVEGIEPSRDGVRRAKTRKR